MDKTPEQVQDMLYHLLSILQITTQPQEYTPEQHAKHLEALEILLRQLYEQSDKPIPYSIDFGVSNVNVSIQITLEITSD
ncbi:MAG: hypothetical protein OHK0046_49780 [Anaerolineae bacterium]